MDDSSSSSSSSSQSDVNKTNKSIGKPKKITSKKTATANKENKESAKGGFVLDDDDAAKK